MEADRGQEWHEKSFHSKLLNNFGNSLTGPIRFELWHQLRKIGPTDHGGHCIAAWMQHYVATAGKISQILEQDQRSWFLVLDIGKVSLVGWTDEMDCNLKKVYLFLCCSDWL